METRNFSKKQKRSFFFHRGFTLIELLVVISIMSIMASVGFMSYQSSKRDASLRAAQREVATVIRLAQSYATQGKTQGSGSSEFTPCGYGFKFINSSTYQIFYVSGSPCQDTTYSSTSIESRVGENFTLDNDVTITNSNFDDTVAYFRVPFGVVQGNNGGAFSGTTIILRHPSNPADTMSIQIGPNGKITEDN